MKYLIAAIMVAVMPACLLFGLFFCSIVWFCRLIKMLYVGCLEICEEAWRELICTK